MNQYIQTFEKLVKAAKLVDPYYIVKQANMYTDGLRISFGTLDGVAFGSSSLSISYQELENITPEEIAEAYNVIMEQDRIKREQSRCSHCGHIKHEAFNIY